ncbi:hypothetical protein B0H14DRAFT_2581330 [Mycena olivaceomarginata]|nr:hypothetical protein B0H14DRAFT_2581330 [Mycena olivaceomarginata]
MSSSVAPRVCTSYGPTFIEMFSERNSVVSATPSPSSKWTQLTENEAHAVIQSHLCPNTAPPVPVRPSIPRSEINRLSRKIWRENTLQRTINPISAAVIGPATPDQRILHACRRKSYTAPSTQFEGDSTPLW